MIRSAILGIAAAAVSTTSLAAHAPSCGACAAPACAAATCCAPPNVRVHVHRVRSVCHHPAAPIAPLVAAVPMYVQPMAMVAPLAYPQYVAPAAAPVAAAPIRPVQAPEDCCTRLERRMDDLERKLDDLAEQIKSLGDGRAHASGARAAR